LALSRACSPTKTSRKELSPLTKKKKQAQRRKQIIYFCEEKRKKLSLEVLMELKNRKTGAV